jgi:hypothetical protein
MRVAGLGVILTGALSALVWVVWGSQAALAGALFGLLAATIHEVAVAALRRVWNAPFRNLVRGWAVGMGLRMGGAGVWMVAVLVREDFFPPLPTAICFLGVLIPLLFTEMHFLK